MNACSITLNEGHALQTFKKSLNRPKPKTASQIPGIACKTPITKHASGSEATQHGTHVWLHGVQTGSGKHNFQAPVKHSIDLMLQSTLAE